MFNIVNDFVSSSIINLSLPSPTISALSSPSTPLSPNSYAGPSLPAYKPISPLPQNICPRFLRRRARSSLVDAFRLYILHELNQRVPQGGYYIWILHSLLNEVRQRQEKFLARERERERERLKSLGPPPQYIPLIPPSSRSVLSLGTSLIGSSSLLPFGRKRQNLRHERRPSNETFLATTSCEPPASDDEEDIDSGTSCTRTQERSDETDGNTIDTDTDDCSIQTPTSEDFDRLLGLPSTIASQDLPLLPSPYPISNQSYLDSPLPTSNSVYLQIQNLTQLILLHNSHSARMVYEENTRLDALEARGKRRAWLNRALCPNGTEFTRSSGETKMFHQRKMKIGIGASYSRLGFSVPIQRSTLGIYVVNAEDAEPEKAAPMSFKDAGSSQIDTIILEDDIQVVSGERFSGHDERNGIEPKRSRIPVPSNGVQLPPVDEVEEEENLEHKQDALCVSFKSLGPTKQGDDGFSDLNLNQFDDLREFQMDLNIVTGIRSDIMDSSDEEDTESHINISVPHRQDQTTTRNPEGCMRVTFDVARHRIFNARSSHFLSDQKQCQRQRVLEASCDQEYHAHQYSHPDTLSERCHTPISPSFPLGPVSEPVDLATPTSVPSISVSQPTTLPAISSEYIANDPIIPNSPLSVVKNLETPFRPLSRAASRHLEPGSRTGTDGSELGPILHNVPGNDMDELIAGIDAVRLGEDRREEFTLAMDLPSKLPRLSFAAPNRAFKGRSRGEIQLRGPHDVANPEDMSAIVEEAEGD